VEIEKIIGQKLRKYRKSKNITIAQLSESANISEAQLSRIENGKTSAPISTLDVIAKALGVSIGVFFEDNETKNNPRIVITKKHQGKTSRRGLREFGYNYKTLASEKKNRLMDPFLLRIDKDKADESIVFSHPGEEVLYVLKGSMQFTYEGQKFNLQEGDSIYFDATGSHITKNTGDTDLEFLVVICSITQ